MNPEKLIAKWSQSQVNDSMLSPDSNHFQPRDFIETSDDLIFAVVDARIEQGRVLSFLRYRREGGRVVKQGTEKANAWLAGHHADLLFDSPRLAARLHGVPVDRIARHYRPRQRAAELAVMAAPDSIEAKAQRCLAIFQAGGIPLTTIGITGSLLIGAQHPASDLDFVIYDRDAFHRARDVVRDAIVARDLAELAADDWREAYDRRGCDLGFDDYLWHERRKLNKGLCDGTKFDITLVADAAESPSAPVRKLGCLSLTAEVTDASQAFDFPARYRLAHPEIGEVLSFSHTYAGQALAGEWVEMSGQLEQTDDGVRRIIVGSTREAPGEFIKVRRVLPAFSAVIFDMDGLVLDSETTYCGAWRKAAAALGHELDDAFFESLFGRHADDVVQALAAELGPRFDREGFFRAAERYWFEHIETHGIPRMPGIEALLARFREASIPYALATNSDGHYARLCLERGGLHDAFPVMVTRDQVALGKPEPDVFLEAARRLNVDPAACLVLEDSETGLMAARAAGTQPILIQRREDLRARLEPLAKLALFSLEDLVDLIKSHP
jgi:HAD superfamily hydrolase (TIGR01509 family)